jgi:hypothetical protein
MVKQPGSTRNRLAFGNRALTTMSTPRFSHNGFAATKATRIIKAKSISKITSSSLVRNRPGVGFLSLIP